jgi:hypothetical protein
MGTPWVGSALPTRERLVAGRIVAITARLVEQVRAEEWAVVPDTLRERRGLLRELRPLRADGPASSCIEALHAAVYESERVLLQLVPAQVVLGDPWR